MAFSSVSRRWRHCWPGCCYDTGRLRRVVYIIFKYPGLIIRAVTQDNSKCNHASFKNVPTSSDRRSWLNTSDVMAVLCWYLRGTKLAVSLLYDLTLLVIHNSYNCSTVCFARHILIWLLWNSCHEPIDKQLVRIEPTGSTTSPCTVTTFWHS